nr:hypothetical protein PZA16_20055 [Klebsiella pneumoniae]
MKKALFSLFLIVSLFYSYKLLGLWSLIFFVVGVSLLASLKIGRRAYLISNSGSKTNTLSGRDLFADVTYNPATGSPMVSDVDVSGSFYGLNKKRLLRAFFLLIIDLTLTAYLYILITDTVEATKKTYQNVFVKFRMLSDYIVQHRTIDDKFFISTGDWLFV